MIVVDVNLVAYLLLQSENTDLAEQVFNRDAEWFGPVLWRSEFRNILVTHRSRHSFYGMRESKKGIDCLPVGRPSLQTDNTLVHAAEIFPCLGHK